MPRRANGEGSYYYNDKKMLWYWSVVIQGKRYQLTSKKRKDLKAKIEIFRKTRAEQGETYNDKIVMKDWTDRWLKAVKPTVKLRTYDYYERCIRLYINPKLGDRKLKDLKQIELQEFLNTFTTEKGAKGELLGVSTINGIRRTLKTCLAAAVGEGIISIDPSKNTKALKINKSKEIIVLEKEQLRNLIVEASKQDYIYHDVKQKYIEDDGMKYHRNCYYYLLILEAATGLRQGEIFALSWDDINWERREIIVNHNMQMTSEGLQFGTPKSGKGRKLEVDSDTITALKKWHDYQLGYIKQYNGIFRHQRNLIFTNSVGSPVNVSSYLKNYWKKLKNYVELPDGFRWYDLRHTHATLLILSGVPIKVVSERLGHASVEQTVNTYYNLIPNLQKTAVEAYSKLDILSKTLTH